MKELAPTLHILKHGRRQDEAHRGHVGHPQRKSKRRKRRESWPRLGRGWEGGLRVEGLPLGRGSAAEEVSGFWRMDDKPCLFLSPLGASAHEGLCGRRSASARPQEFPSVCLILQWHRG